MEQESKAAREEGPPLRVAHLITRLIIGGAQENTLSTVEDQQLLFGDEVILVTGPGLGPEGSLEARALANGVKLHLLPRMARSIRPWNDWRSLLEMRRILKEFRPQIIHTHSSKMGILGRWLAAWLGVPCVHTIHGASFHHGQHPAAYWLYRKLEQQAGPLTSHFVSVCDAMSRFYVDAKVALPEKFTTVYSGFDVEPFLHSPIDPAETRSLLGLKPEHIIIGKVARLFHLKGHKFLLAAARQIVEACPEARFLLVGDGVLRQEFEAFLQQNDLAQYFVFTGLVPPAEVAKFVHAMDIVVHTSEWEGLARVLPQGLIAGKPVVSFAIDGAPEVVLPNETGFLVERGNVAGLAEVVIRLVRDQGLRERLGRTGRERFQTVFRHEFMTSEIRKVYRMVLAKQRVGRN